MDQVTYSRFLNYVQNIENDRQEKALLWSCNHDLIIYAVWVKIEAKQFQIIFSYAIGTPISY